MEEDPMANFMDQTSKKKLNKQYREFQTKNFTDLLRRRQSVLGADLKNVPAFETDKEDIDNLQFFTIFDKLFKSKLKGLLKKLKKNEKCRDDQHFQFARQRVAQIEREVQRRCQTDASLRATRITRLENEGAAGNAADLQKELMRGQYSITLPDQSPYPFKVVLMAQEPVAFQLYKNRHFHRLTEEAA